MAKLTAEFSRAPLHCKLKVLSGVSVDTWVIIGKLWGGQILLKINFKKNDNSTIIDVWEVLFYL